MSKSLKYVTEFEFPSDKGYSASAGKTMVKGYERGGSCGYAKGGMKRMKKAEGGAVDDPRRPLMDRSAPEYFEALAKDRADARRPLMDRTTGEYIDAINRERLMDRARQMFGSNPTEAEMQFLMRGEGRKPISQGLRSPRAEMARERALLGADAGYKKGGMAMRKQYPTNRSEPMVKMAKGGAAPKPDMLFSKKEVNAKNLLADGKGAPMPHPKGSVNMAKGGMTSKQTAKVGKVMGEFKAGELHSGSKSGPVVKNRQQAIAIGMSEARKAKK